MATAPVRITGLGMGAEISNLTVAYGHQRTCHPSESSESVILFTISAIGGLSNLFLMVLVIVKKPRKRQRQSWSQGLLLHQALVDLARALLLIPLAISVMLCQRLSRCSIIDTAFLLLVTVSTVNMLTCLINDAPIFPEYEQLGSLTTAAATSSRRELYWMEANGLNRNPNNDKNSPHCIIFGIFIIWFASLTINLGPTFLSGALASSTDSFGRLDVCPMVYKPVRHYVLNLLWIFVNLMCVALMAIHLQKLYKDIIKSNLEAVRVASLVTTMMTVQSDSDQEDQRNFYDYVHRLEKEGLMRVKMFVIILIAYLLFFGPLFTVTLAHPGLEISLTYEISLHLALTHCFINPILFAVLYVRGKNEPETRAHNNSGNRNTGENHSCCGCSGCVSSTSSVNNSLPNTSTDALSFHHTDNPHHSRSYKTANFSNYTSNDKRMETTI